MGNILLLSKIILKTAFAEVFHFKFKGSFWSWFIRISIILSISFFVILLGFQGFFLQKLFIDNGADSTAFYQIIIPITGFTLLLLNPITILTLLYFSSDNSLYLPLPIKMRHLLTARLLSAYLVILLELVIFLLPLFIGAFVVAPCPWQMYIFLTIIFFTLPIFPIIILTIISLILTRIIPLKKLRSSMMVISIVFILAFTTLISLSSPLMESNNNGAGLISIDSNLIYRFNLFFPFTYFAGISLGEANSWLGLLYFLLFIVIVIGAIILVFILSEWFYLRAITNIETGSKKKVKKLQEEDFLQESTVTILGLMKLELKQIRRTTIFFLYFFIVPLLMPLILAIGLIPTIFDSSIKNIDLGFLSNGAAFLVALGFALFILMMNYSGPTSISREGKSAFYLKYTPISFRKIILAKLFLPAIINTISYLVFLVLAICLFFPFSMDGIFFVIYLTITFTLLNLGHSYLAVLSDAKNPKLNWDNAYRLLKNNFRLVKFMLLSAIVSIALFILGTNLYSANLNLHLMGILTIILAIILDSVLLSHLFKLEAKDFFKKIT